MDDQEWRRRARREFIRDRHPDRGGDPAAFVAGLAELDLALVHVPPARVVVVQNTPWLLGLLKALARGISGHRPPPRIK